MTIPIKDKSKRINKTNLMARAMLSNFNIQETLGMKVKKQKSAKLNRQPQWLVS